MQTNLCPNNHIFVLYLTNEMRPVEKLNETQASYHQPTACYISITVSAAEIFIKKWDWKKFIVNIATLNRLLLKCNPATLKTVLVLVHWQQLNGSLRKPMLRFMLNCTSFTQLLPTLGAHSWKLWASTTLTFSRYLPFFHSHSHSYDWVFPFAALLKKAFWGLLYCKDVGCEGPDVNP